MTLNKRTDQIIEAVRPEIHDDDILDRRYIKDLIHQQRAVWARNSMNKERDIPEQLIQSLGCVPIQKASVAECCDFASGCKIFRTVNKIPIPISLQYREAIVRVGPAMSNEKPFTVKDYTEAIFFGNGRFNGRMAIAFYKDGYIWLMSKSPVLDLLQNISIRIVAENPSQAANFNNCTGEPCYSDDDPYPLTDAMWQYMKEYIITEIMRKSMLQIDDENDNNHGQIVPGGGRQPQQNASKPR